jgi:hypothetical protein
MNALPLQFLMLIVEGLRPLIGRPTLLTQHQGHHPIIELTSPTTATGSWYLQDICYERRENWWFHGTAYYADGYVKRDGARPTDPCNPDGCPVESSGRFF